MLELIIVLSIIVLVEGVIIWSLSGVTDKYFMNDFYKDKILNKAYYRIMELQNERDDLKRKYEKEKRMVNHKDRVIQAIYRGEIIRVKNKQQ